MTRAAFSAGDAYERFMGRWSRSLAPLLVRFAAVQDGDAVLDVGSGTGAIGATIASLAPSSRFVGIDAAAACVSYAQAHHSRNNIRFQEGDAQHLGFADGTFDRTLSLLALNFIPNPEQALHEMTRVTRPGGTIAAAVWDYGDGMEMLRVLWDEMTALIPAMDARDERHMPLARAGELAALWRRRGLEEVTEAPLEIETTFDSFDDYWLPFLEGQGPAGVSTVTLSESKRELLRQRLQRRLVGDGPDRPLPLRARAWAVRGTVGVR